MVQIVVESAMQLAGLFVRSLAFNLQGQTVSEWPRPIRPSIVGSAARFLLGFRIRTFASAPGIRRMLHVTLYLEDGNRRYWCSCDCSRVTPVNSSPHPGRETATTPSTESPHSYQVWYKTQSDPEYHALSLSTVAYLRPLTVAYIRALTLKACPSYFSWLGSP